MKPFFTYYGGKYRASTHLPAPLFDTTIEPFAGSAGYSTRYNNKRVILVEKNPVFANLWRYLIRATTQEILALPDIPLDAKVDDLPIHQEARWLVGMWINKGVSRPMRSPSKWMREIGHLRGNFWGSKVRQRIASQVDQIRHWEVLEGSYEDAPLIKAHWSVDPPYQVAGIHYPCGARQIDFAHLGAWCRTLPGVAIVHENEGATWLPFEPWMHIQANQSRNGGKISKEVICILRDGDVDAELARRLGDA